MTTEGVLAASLSNTKNNSTNDNCIITLNTFIRPI